MSGAGDIGRIMDAFHKHLDQCRQCREHPFALCRIGSAILQGAKP